MSKDRTLEFDSLWQGFHLSAMNAGLYTTQHDAAIAVVDGKIAWVGAAAKLPKHRSKSMHDLKGGWLTPGLIDCHTHLVFGGDRAHEFEQRLLGKSYADISLAGGGIAATVRATRAASEAELLSLAVPRLKALMSTGVTSLEIKSGYGLDQDSELKMLRVARQLEKEFPVSIQTSCLAAHAVPLEFKNDKDAYIDYLCNQLLPAIADSGLADAVDGFCEGIAFSVPQIDRYFTAASKLGLKVKLHAEQLSAMGGASLAAKHGALSADHLEYATQDDVMAMASAGTVAVLLPGAFYSLNESQTPPINLFRQYGVAMAVATDLNPGTSPVLSLPLMMNMVCTMFGLSPEEALAGTTIHAAKALGLEKTKGILAVGMDADFVCWDVNKLADLSYWVGGNFLKARIKAGHLSNIV